MLSYNKVEVSEANRIALTKAIDSIAQWPTFPIHIPGVLELQSLAPTFDVVMSAFASLGDTYPGCQAFACNHKSRDDSRKAILELFNRQNAPTAEDFLGLLVHSTLIIREAYKVLPIALDLRSVWRNRFSCHINTNIYASSPSSDAFPLHQDPHHVFSLQLAGTKRWWLSEAHCGDLKRHSDQEAMEITCHSGDMLFIPKGFPHRAKASEVSVHVSLSIEEKVPLDTH